MAAVGDLVVQRFVSADGFAANERNGFDLRRSNRVTRRRSWTVHSS